MTAYEQFEHFALSEAMQIFSNKSVHDALSSIVYGAWFRVKKEPNISVDSSMRKNASTPEETVEWAEKYFADEIMSGRPFGKIIRSICSDVWYVAKCSLAK